MSRLGVGGNGGDNSNVWRLRRGNWYVELGVEMNETDDEDHEYGENVRGEREQGLQSIRKTVGTEENEGQGHPDCT